ncbi:MAG: DUF1566 domain-containing protein [Pseudomonadota bacterium]
MKLIGKYEVRGLLGRGGMGAVYKVRLPALEKMMALKLLAPQPALTALLGPGEIRRRFILEAQTMGRLRHHNLASVTDFEDRPGQTFFVMEYYCLNLGEIIGEGRDVEAPSRRIAVPQACSYVFQTLQGLARLHLAGVVHRDVKPFNLLVTDQDQVKITDFGLSLLRGEVASGPWKLKVGSPFHAAPEQVQDPESAGPPADLFSVGVMLHRFITGRLPAPELPVPSILNPELDDRWDRFFEKALRRAPEQRFQNAGEMSDALARLLETWRTEREGSCPDAATPAFSDSLREFQLRGEAKKIAPAEARKFFGLDELWRPRLFSPTRLIPRNDGTVSQPATGLTWEAAGSVFPLTWLEAREYLDDLNEKQFAGRRNWRLPTVDELLTLLARPGNEAGSCLAPSFPPDRKRLWSADQRSALAAWYVNMDHGFASWRDFSCCFHVRGVSPGPGPERGE